jgi:hypothetical protein
MKDKRGTKLSHSPFKEGSSLSSGISMPSSTIFGSPPPPGYPLEISSHRPYSLVFEQGGHSEKVSMVDLSSSLDEECLIPDTSWDEEFAKRLFGDLNRDVVEPSDDSKIIILSDSDEEEEEVCEEDVADVEAGPSFVVRSPAPTASADDVDKGDTHDWVIGGSNSCEDEASLP